jgi:transcriptional regulator GlxA family with amidase domain
MAGAPPGAETQVMREALLVLILGRFLRTEAPPPSGGADLDELIEWLQSRTPDALDAAALAARLGVSLGTLRRRFHARLGISPARYLLRLRINEAKRLLAETRMPIKEIAARCGYGSSIAFHRAFRDVAGTTPRRFRLRNRVAG